MNTATARTPVPRAAVFEDSLGKRYSVSGPDGEPLDVFALRDELTAVSSFEFALRERVSALAAFQHPSFARIRGVQKLGQPTPTLAVVTDAVAGARLSSILKVAEAQLLPIEINAAIYLIRQLVHAMATLHEKMPGISHGAIAPERLVITPDARLVILDHALGAALEQLHFSPEQYWKDLSIPLPTPAGVPRFDQRADVMQMGAVALALIVGRPLYSEEYPDKIGAVAERAWGVTSTGSVEPLPFAVRTWLARALQLDARQSFASAVDAWAELDRVVGGSDYVAPVGSVQSFLAEYDKHAGTNGAATETMPPVFAVSVAPPTASVAPLTASVAPPTASVAPPTASAAPPTASVAPLTASAAPLTASIAPRAVPFVPPAVPVAPPVVPITLSAPPVPIALSAPRVPIAPASDVNVAAPSKPTVAPSPVVAPPPRPPARSPAEPLSPAPELTPAARVQTLGQFLVEEEPEVDMTNTTPRSRLRWIAAAVVLVALASGGALAARSYLAPSAVAAVSGTLVVDTNPAGAPVVIDGRPRGVTPLTLALTPGAHTLVLVTDGEPRTIPLTITAGGMVSQFIELPKAGAVTGQLQVRSEPSGARVSVDGMARGVAPLTIDGLTPGAHTVMLVNGLGSVEHEVKVEAGATASLVVPMTAPQGAPVSGWISVTAPADVQVYEDTRLLGSSRSDRIMVSVGRHELDIVNEALGYRVTRTVIVAPGQVAALRLEWPKGSMSLNAQPWADVWIDGEHLGETPIGNVALPIGTHEVVFRHPELGEQVVPATVTLNGTARLSVDMRKR